VAGGVVCTDLSGSEPSLKNQPDRVKSAPMTGRPALSSRIGLRTSTHRPNNGPFMHTTTVITSANEDM